MNRTAIWLNARMAAIRVLGALMSLSAWRPASREAWNWCAICWTNCCPTSKAGARRANRTPPSSAVSVPASARRRIMDEAGVLFVRDGYEATSMQDLVDCMGINRGSLYATFGDKRALFIRALRHYDAIHRAAWVARLLATHTPKSAIVAAFDDVFGIVLGYQGHEFQGWDVTQCP